VTDEALVEIYRTKHFIENKYTGKRPMHSTVFTIFIKDDSEQIYAASAAVLMMMMMMWTMMMIVFPETASSQQSDLSDVINFSYVIGFFILRVVQQVSAVRHRITG
jgi:hypothetical protein